MARKYELKRRAERQEETRRRIVDATVALHEELGPARTTISAIAERAGVERLTVYRHFPDERSLFGACSHRFNELIPVPDPTPWTKIADPSDRLRTGLADVYAYFRQGEQMLANVFRDATESPALQEVLAPFDEYWEEVRATLLAGWEPRDDEQLLLAALGHALEFETWRSLVRRNNLTDEQAIELMVRLVTCASDREEP